LNGKIDTVLSRVLVLDPTIKKWDLMLDPFVVEGDLHLKKHFLIDGEIVPVMDWLYKRKRWGL
jgi:hypothetical protein